MHANQAWAPYPDNDPDRARELIERFYFMVVGDGRLDLDPAQAVRLEWSGDGCTASISVRPRSPDIARTLQVLYSYGYGVEAQAVREAVEQRVLAMRLSDE